MKKSKVMTVLGAMAAGALGLVSSPSGQQLAEQSMQQVKGQQVTQQAPQRYLNQQGQQAQRANPGQTVQQYLQNPTIPGGGGLRIAGNYSMSPKEYGEYLMRTGKDKYNKRKRKHIAKGIA